MSLIQKEAPQFTTDAVVNGDFKRISLSDFKGKWVYLFFYPFDFTFVCPTEIVALSDAVERFEKINTQVLGCSIDSKHVHLRWVNTPRADGGLGGCRYPLLADVTKDIARFYDVLLDGGMALRGSFFIDPKQIVRAATLNDLAVGRSVDEAVRMLEAFQYTDQYGEVCPANWMRGSDTIKPDPKKAQEYFKKHG